MSTKIIRLDERFPTGEPTVQLVATWGRNSRLLREDTSLKKTAAHSPAMDYIKTVEPEPGKSIILVIGLGASEAFGPNRNGDAFPAEPVEGKVEEHETLPHHYKTFENAKVYKHHVNHDPDKAIGTIKKAFWNDYMRRVELLEDVDHAKAPDIAQKIMDGEYLPTSMGCLCAGTEILTKSGSKLIENIVVGDEVLTQSGEFHAVTALHPRNYKGKLYRVHTTSGVTYATADHPYGWLPATAAEKTKNYCQVKKAAEEIDLHNLQWMPAEGLLAGDYLVTPFNTEVKETLTVDQCRLLGYYCAEGFAYYSNNSETPTGLNFSHNKTDAFTFEGPALLRKLSTANIHTHQAVNSEPMLRTDIHDSALAKLCVKHVGRLAATKCLSLELMQQPVEQQLAFLGAYINGDGGMYDNEFYVCSCNKSLIYQIQQLGFRCGLYSKINTIHHKPSKLVQKHTTEYRADFPKPYCNKIAAYSIKVPEYTMKDHSSASFILTDKALVSKIRTIEVSDFEGPVYNFEVETDNSYVANNHLSHNCKIAYDVCSICGNRAKTRGDYCDHLRYEMGRIHPNGKIACALNPSPRFFDQSFVIRPADRTALMIKKVAQETPYEIYSSFEQGDAVQQLAEKLALVSKAADIEKIIANEPVASSSTLGDKDLQLLQRYSRDVAPDAAAKMKPLSSKSVKVTISYEPSEVLSTSDSAGMPLAVSDLIKYFVNRMSGGNAELDSDTADCAAKHASLVLRIFEEYPRLLDDVIKIGGLDISDEKVSAKLAAAMPQRGVLADYAYRTLVPEAYRDGGREKALTDPITYTDPVTRQQYQTTWGVARDTNDAIARSQLDKAVLGAGTLFGTAATLSSLKNPRGLTGPIVYSDTGEPISGWTEMVPKTAEFVYTVRRHMDKAAGRLPDAYIHQVLPLLKEAEIIDDLSDLLGPTLDLEKVAYIVGASILSWS